MIIDHGTFSLYEPELPVGHPLKGTNTLFLKNGSGLDWYSIAHAQPTPGRVFVSVWGDRADSISADPSTLWPIDCRLIETDEVVEHGWLFTGSGFEPPSPTVAEVLAERARRLALGFDYDFGDARGIHHIGTTPQDMTGWDEVSKVAAALMALGQTGAQIEIETNTGPVTVTALDWQQILVAAGQFRQPIWLASFALQKMDPIPDDFADDSYWPTSSGGTPSP